jgi:hypothetical protein
LPGAPIADDGVSGFWPAHPFLHSELRGPPAIIANASKARAENCAWHLHIWAALVTIGLF